MEMEEIILQKITQEIEKRFICKVISISLCSIIGTLNVMCKIKYNDDFIYKPCENWTPDSICFSERLVTFTRRIDFFNCMKENSSYY